MNGARTAFCQAERALRSLCVNRVKHWTHGGLNDVRKHIATSKHQEMLKATSSTMNLESFFRPSPVEESITRAEVLFANFIAEHNLAFMLADHFTHLASAMFPDSQVAKAFRCAATKTTCIVLRVHLIPTFLSQ